MRTVPDWAIQGSWWVSGIFATGAIWYFLAVKSYPHLALSAAAAIAFAALAVFLHRKKDQQDQHRVSASSEPTPAEDFARRYADQPSHIRFIRALPKLKAVVYENAHEGWDTGVTAEMREANYDVIDFLEYTWQRLAEFYPPKHFGDKDAKAFARNYIRDRFAFHWGKYEPDGPGTGGTIVGVLTGGDVITDMEKMVADTVEALFGGRDDFDFKDWLSQWQPRQQ